MGKSEVQLTDAGFPVPVGGPATPLGWLIQSTFPPSSISSASCLPLSSHIWPWPVSVGGLEWALSFIPLSCLVF